MYALFLLYVLNNVHIAAFQMAVIGSNGNSHSGIYVVAASFLCVLPYSGLRNVR